MDTPTGKRAAAYAFNPTGATRALELLGRHLGMFEHRLAVRHEDMSQLRLKELVARVQMLQDEGRGSPPMIEGEVVKPANRIVPFGRH
jgi:hypothetical protein